MRIIFSLHVHGWNLNELDFEDVKNGIEEVEEIVKKIQTLPRDREIMETIFKEIFDLDTDFAIENIHKVCPYLNAKLLLHLIKNAISFNYAILNL